LWAREVGIRAGWGDIPHFIRLARWAGRQDYPLGKDLDMAHSILVTVTLPTTRADGTALAPSDLSEVDILRATVTGGVVGAFAPLASITAISGPAVTFIDSSVVDGQTYEYEADCIDKQSPPVTGAVSAPTPNVAVPLALAPPSAPSVQAAVQ
jgi:hypothetical protein